MLPGYRIETKPKKNFHKTQVFDVKNGIRVDKDRHADVVDARNVPLNNSLANSLLISRTPEDFKTGYEARGAPQPGTLSGEERLPAWVAYDRKVLRYYAYFKESVVSSAIETWRVRKCVIYYYLEDDSVHVAEPKQENSGIPQGVFIKRHRIPKADNTYVAIDDLRIGSTLEVYGRVFYLVDADDFTRQFAASNGIHLSAPLNYPVDQFQKKTTNIAHTNHKIMNPLKLFMEARLGKPMTAGIEATQKFLKNDGKVLRFYCTWNDTNMYGEKRPYIVHYFLADDTVEVLEILQPNSGRDTFPALLKRQQLPIEPSKATSSVSEFGERESTEHRNYYRAGDFRVGMQVNVYGRPLDIMGCDKFTQDFYVRNFNAQPQDYPELDVGDEQEAPRVIEPPPYNGFGTEEDSLGSFLYLMPKVPKTDFKKLMENDNITLRYLAEFVDPQVEDKERRFIITYYANNDTVSIFERFERNSGFIGGKFLERSRIKNPATGEYFKAADFEVGTQLTLNTFQFRLIDSDEATAKCRELLLSQQ